MRLVNTENVPPEVIKELDHQKRMNGGEWLPTNYCWYYPNKVNFKNDKVIVYVELEHGGYAIESSFIYS